MFGQIETDADDATVRVYVHRLRKKLEDHYTANPPAEGAPQLEIPAGVYALQLVGWGETADAVEAGPPGPRRGVLRYWPVLAALALLAAFPAGYAMQRGLPGTSNAIWDPVIESERPVLLVLGDYYIYGEIDPVTPEEGRLIRDFRANSAADLERMQDLYPERFGVAEDMGLNYLPFSAAYGLQDIVPLLEMNGKPVSVIAASELEPDMLNYFNIVYVGLLSGLELLEDQTFTGSGLRLGESYDEMVDRESQRTFVSEEARSMASPAFYRDFALVTRFAAPGGALVTIIASERDTGLRGISPIVTSADFPDELSDAAGGNPAFEAVFQITGQQGADLNEQLVLARARE